MNACKGGGWRGLYVEFEIPLDQGSPEEKVICTVRSFDRTCNIYFTFG